VDTNIALHFVLPARNSQKITDVDVQVVKK
jgi:hypothetical protein